MEQLPSSIEAYLDEAGFSGMEILILKKLMEEDALTLRELASKTGKSTGGLDQAVKKLLKKGIVTREVINDTPKYLLHSLQTVGDWMKKDMEMKQRMIVRRHENFEAFLASIQKRKTRPEMEYFEGLEGLKTAYIRLLDYGKVMLSYGPQPWSADEDPLHDFRQQYYRERRKRGIFARVVTHDTPVGRKLQSRDPFEYRETLLVERMKFPFSFERIVIGDTVACFQFEQQRACFIHYPELAEEERVFFERMWHEQKLEKHIAEMQKKNPGASPVITVEAVTENKKILSHLKEFFLTKRSLEIIALLAILSVGVTYGMYKAEAALNLKRVQDKVSAIAATAAVQFKSADLDQLHVLRDIHKPVYAKVVNQLNVIRNQNKNIKYAYIFRKTQESDIYSFIADADSLNPYAKKDLNGDGVIDDSDALDFPGEAYSVDPNGAFELAMNGAPSADKQPYSDKWGTFISGAAPIRNASGGVVAILGVDMYANEVNVLTNQTFFPVFWFFIFLVIFIGIRLVAFDQSLLLELYNLCARPKVLVLTGASIGISLSVTAGLYFYTQHLNFQRIQREVQAVAEAAAPQFNANDINALQVEDDWHKPQWAIVVNQLAQIKKNNPDLVYVYIIRKVKNDPSKMEFVSDAGSLNPFANTDTDPTNDVDANGDGVIDPNGADYLQWPGQPYDDPPKEGFIAYDHPTVTANFYADSYGKVISGYAPIRDGSGKTVAVVAVDMKAQNLNILVKNSISPIYIFVICEFFLVIFYIVFMHSKNLSNWNKF